MKQLTKTKNQLIDNVIPEKRDVLTQTTGLADNSIDYVMLFNILHHESPDDFFNEAFRILKPKARLEYCTGEATWKLQEDRIYLSDQNLTRFSIGLISKNFPCINHQLSFYHIISG